MRQAHSIIRRGLIAALLFAGSLYAAEWPLRIRVKPKIWKGASKQDVHAILTATARDFWPEAKQTDLDPIVVGNWDRGPIVFYDRGQNGEFRVNLDTGKTYWSQYAFQFAHELCHIRSRYREGNRENKWFEESLCETASLYALRVMAKSWEHNPPYSNWKEYRKSLRKYAQDRIDKSPLPEGRTLAQWYVEHQAELRSNPTDRARNNVVAVQLLPLFEEKPDRWDAVTWLNETDVKGSISFEQHLENWRASCPEKHRGTVDLIRKRFLP